MPEHPFYVKERSHNDARPKPIGHEDLNSYWVGAGHLKIGDKIKQADGTTGVVANVTTVQKTQEMFNLTVSEAHTFYVGTQGWLVHNCNGRTLLGWDNQTTWNVAGKLKAAYHGGDPRYAEYVETALRDPKSKIMVHIDDQMIKEYGSVEDAMEAMVANVTDNFRGRGLATAPIHDGFGYSATDWEMYMITKLRQGGFKGVDFVRDAGGAIVKMVNPFKGK